MDAWPVIIPPSPGVLCAYGDATTRVKDEGFALTGERLLRPDEGRCGCDPGPAHPPGERVPGGPGYPRDQQVVTWEADVRYQGQALLLTQVVEPETLRSEGLDVLRRAFDAEHLQLFSFSLDEEHELVNLRATARAPRPNIRERQWAVGEGSSDVAIVGESPIYYEGRETITPRCTTVTI